MKDEFSIEDLEACWNGWERDYFVDVLNGQYDLEEARKDLRSLINTKWDKRHPNNKKAN